MALRVKCLLHKTKDLSLNPQYSQKARYVVVTQVLLLRDGRRRQRILRNSWGSQPGRQCGGQQRDTVSR